MGGLKLKKVADLACRLAKYLAMSDLIMLNAQNEPHIEINENELSRTERLLHIIKLIREEPHTSLDSILERFQISRSQFYKDREALADLGFRFAYSAKKGFIVLEDRLAPLTGMSLSDRIILLFALSELCAQGDALLVERAMALGRKLAGGLTEPFRQQLLASFDKEITQKAYGIKPELLQDLVEAISERRRIKILYSHGGSWIEKWRVIDPRRIYIRKRALYLYGRVVDEQPAAWKAFRIARIKELKTTGITFASATSEDKQIWDYLQNTFLGSAPPFVIHFKSQAAQYVKERIWHPSQKILALPDGSIIFSVTVAETGAVRQWAKEFGGDATIIMEDADFLWR